MRFANYDAFDVWGTYGIGDLLNEPHQHRIPKRKGGKIGGTIIGDPTMLILAPTEGGSGGVVVGNGTIQKVNGGTFKLSENVTYNFQIILQNGYSVGSSLDKNAFKLNKGKATVVIKGQISGQWIKFNPTLVRLGYAITNRLGIVKITSPSNLYGYEIPLQFLKLL
jgi:hypothetical protein